MDDNLQPKAVLPLVFSVVVMEHTVKGPEPVLAVEFRQDGHVALKGPGNAALCYSYLVAAARLAGRQIAENDLRAGLEGTLPAEEPGSGGPVDDVKVSAGEVF